MGEGSLLAGPEQGQYRPHKLGSRARAGASAKLRHRFGLACLFWPLIRQRLLDGAESGRPEKLKTDYTARFGLSNGSSLTP
jgi:hypothetical protein